MIRSLLLFLAWQIVAVSVADARDSDDERGNVDWESLDPLQGVVSRAELIELLDELYAPRGRWKSWLRLEEDVLLIRREDEGFADAYRLKLKPADPAGGREARFGQRPRSLRGLRIAIDPGHIGGEWGPLERRSFAIGQGALAQEGDLTLATARRLRDELESLGAVVWLTREQAEPSTSLRPRDFMEEAAKRLESRSDLSPADREEAQRVLAERLFYVVAEIQARAERLNREFRPDLAIALHINAAPWSDATRFSLTTANNAHVIVHGSYLASELADEQLRLQMLQRLLRGYHRVELPLAKAMAEAMVAATGLPPYQYRGDNALLLDDKGYVWARNLLANRIFECPVVYMEPWILNSEAVYEWAVMGDYAGYRWVSGEERRSLPSVYAGFVREGLLRYIEGGP